MSRDRDLLIDPKAGPVLAEIVCGKCGRRLVAVVQRDGRVQVPSGAVISGPLLRYLMGKVTRWSTDGARGYAVGGTILREGLAERSPICPRHGGLVLELGSLLDAISGPDTPVVVSAMPAAT